MLISLLHALPCKLPCNSFAGQHVQEKCLKDNGLSIPPSLNPYRWIQQYRRS